MKIAFVGCGYVFDIYMRTFWAHPELQVCGVFDIDAARLNVVSKHYGFHAYPSFEAVLADPEVETVINLTSIRSHYEVIKRSLEAGKHVYSEKPLTTDLAQVKELFKLAKARGRILTGAPCNIYSDAITTIWKALLDGAIGKPVLIYAELDDNPAHLMSLEHVQSPTGAPFPYAEEFQEGCTMEHIGYHLVWLCAMFGPVVSLSGFSKVLVPHKTATPLTPPDTPDFSVGCFNFANGVAARVTCSWVAPRNHSMYIFGDDGQIAADNAFHDQTHVYLERFSRVSLSARKSYTVRTQPLIGRIFGIGGRRLKLLRRWKSYAVEQERGVGRSLKHKLVSWLRRKEIYAQDKLLGIAEMSRAIQENRPQPLTPDFLTHITELTLLVQRAGDQGLAMRPTTTFEPLAPLQEVAESPVNYKSSYKPRFMERAMLGVVAALHKR